MCSNYWVADSISEHVFHVKGFFVLFDRHLRAMRAAPDENIGAFCEGLLLALPDFHPRALGRPSRDKKSAER